MRNRLHRNGREWVSSDLPWPMGTRSWHSRDDDTVFLTVHSPGRKRSAPGLWQWATSHRDDGSIARSGTADTREAAMDAAVAVIGVVRNAYDDSVGLRQSSMLRQAPDA
jgi:hypothetical protein